MKRIFIVASLFCGAVLFFYRGKAYNLSEEAPPAIFHKAPITAASSPVNPTAKRPAISRRPAAKAAPSLESFLASSHGAWTVARSSFGFVEKLSGASFPGRGLHPSAAARAFLDEYAEPLLGVSASSLKLAEPRLGERSSQIIYEQEINGRPVQGSRVNLIYGAAGELLYFSATAYPGRPPQLTAKFNQADAAQALQKALSAYVEKAGASSTAPEYGLDRVAAGITLSYRLVGDSISLIYKAEIPLAAPLYGSAEGIVDAQTNTVVSLRPLVKN